ncbi:MAG: hypothetical protein JXL97_19420, partial [Bacteroidales bacterium]|nr:hypothetical protein [Bacteroidales bacterium]
MKKSKLLSNLVILLGLITLIIACENPTATTPEKQSEEYTRPVGVPFMVKDIFSNYESSNPQYLTVFQNKLVFNADSSFSYKRLWIYDGQNETIEAPWATSDEIYDPKSFVVWNDILYFETQDNFYESFFWKYTGTGNAKLITDMEATRHGIWYKNKLYLSQMINNNESELCSYDPDSGIDIIADISGEGNDSDPQFFIIYMDKIFFSADDGVTGHELWSYDGVNSPEMVDDIIEGSDSSFP